MSESSKWSSPNAAVSASRDDDAAAWFLSQSRDLFLVTNQTGSIQTVNPAWTDVLGWASQSLIGRNIMDLVHPDDKPLFATHAGATFPDAVLRLKGAHRDWRSFSAQTQVDAGRRNLTVLKATASEPSADREMAYLRQAQILVAETAGVSAWTFDPVALTFRYPYRSAKPRPDTAVALTTLAALEALVYADDREMLRRLFETLTTCGGEGEYVMRLAKPDGGLAHFLVNYRCERLPSGLHTVHGLSQNITAVIEARDAAVKNARLTRQMVESAPFAAAMFDRNLKHLVVSGAWCSILGFDKADFADRTLNDIFPKARGRFIAAQKKALAGETVRRAEDRLVSQDGRLHWVRWEMQPWRDSEGAIAGVLAYLSDVSALVAARREAQSGSRRLKLAVNAARAAVFEIDYVNKAVWLGPNFVKLAGRTLAYADMVGVWSNVHPDDLDHMRYLIASFDTRRPAPMECRLVHSDGSARWVNAHMEIFHDALGRPRRAVGLLMDVDERKRQELALADAERQATVATEAKSRFLANISHEIRTPMNGVLGVLQLIKRDRLDAEDAKLLDEGLASGRMLTELLDDLLDFSKIETGQFELHPEPVDPTQVLVGITGLLEPAASAKGLIMRASADPDLGLISADPLRLRQALYNIMGNAVKFTPSGSVEARLTRSDTPDGPRLRFEVQDTGVGVPEAAQATLFERFEQADGSMSRKFGGSGLGLAITRRLAEMMGGSVGFTSKPGEGSTFWMEIGGDEVAPVAANEDDAEIGDFRVLLVEDNPTNRLVISKLLQALGITVETAEDGEAGVAAAAKGGYDLVLMDIQMPGMDGMEATRRIRAMDGPISTTPVVAITANVLAEQKSNYVAAGMDGVVSKPVSAAALISEITRVTELRAA